MVLWLNNCLRLKEYLLMLGCLQKSLPSSLISKLKFSSLTNWPQNWGGLWSRGRITKPRSEKFTLEIPLLLFGLQLPVESFQKVNNVILPKMCNSVKAQSKTIKDECSSMILSQMVELKHQEGRVSHNNNKKSGLNAPEIALKMATNAPSTWMHTLIIWFEYLTQEDLWYS